MYDGRGINYEAMDKLILDIYSYAEKVNKTLNQILDVVDDTKNFYECEAATNYRNKFNSFSANFNIINKNLISYAEDMIKLKNKYIVSDQNLVSTLKTATAKMESINTKGEYHE